MKVVVSAPGKLMLFGEHAVVYGYPCIVTAVDQRLVVTVKKNIDNTFRFDAPDLGLTGYSKTIESLGGRKLPKEVQFMEALYRVFLERYPQNEGIDVVTQSNFSNRYGFGSSSAVTVAFAKALVELYGLSLSKKELFDLGYRAVLNVQGEGSGFDIAAAVYGGMIYYVSPGKVIRQLASGDLSLVVGYTGVKADTVEIIRRVADKRRRERSMVEKLFNVIAQIVEDAKTAMERSDWKMLGNLMDENQQKLVELGVSSSELDRLIKVAKGEGALGAKLSGAGGGDCMIALVEEGRREAVEQAIEEVGGKVLAVKLGAGGVVRN